MRGARAREMHEVVLPFSGGATFFPWYAIFGQLFNAVGMQILNMAFLRSHMIKDALSSSVIPVIAQIHRMF